DRPILRAELPDSVFVMVNAADGTEHQPCTENNQTEIQEHERQKERQHFVQAVIARGSDKRTEHGEGQREYGDTGAQRSKRSAFLSEQYLDFAKDDIIRRG